MRATPARPPPALLPRAASWSRPSRQPRWTRWPALACWHRRQEVGVCSQPSNPPRAACQSAGGAGPAYKLPCHLSGWHALLCCLVQLADLFCRPQPGAGAAPPGPGAAPHTPTHCACGAQVRTQAARCPGPASPKPCLPWPQTASSWWACSCTARHRAAWCQGTGRPQQLAAQARGAQLSRCCHLRLHGRMRCCACR